MGFLKKIFGGGKKKNKVEDPTSPQGSSPTGRKGKEKAGPGGGFVSSGAATAAAEQSRNGRNNVRSPRPSKGGTAGGGVDGIIARNGSFTNNTYTGSNSSRERDLNVIDISNIDPRDMTQEQLRIAYELSKAGKYKNNTAGGANNNYNNNRTTAGGTTNGSITQNSNTNNTSSYSYDDSLDSKSMKINSSGSAPGVSPRLTSNQLQQWDRHSGGGQYPTASSSRPIYTMSSELPNQQMQAMDDMNRSDASSSSFNLSTDAEDSEYEMFKRRGGYPVLPNTSTLDTSAIETATSYTTDQDSKIFPNLPTDDEMTQATEPSFTKPPPSLLMPLQTPDDEPGRIHIFPPKYESADDFRAWMFGGPSSPSSGVPHEPPTTKSSTSRDQHFFPPEALGTVPHSKPTNPSLPDNKTNKNAMVTMKDLASSSNNVASRNAQGGPHRNFTSPKPQASASTAAFSMNEFGKDFADGFGDFNADFGSFADFSGFPSTSAIDVGGAWKGEEKKVQPWEDMKEQQSQPEIGNMNSSPSKQHNRSHSNPWNTSTSDSSAVMSPSNINGRVGNSSPRGGGGGFDDGFDAAVSRSEVSGSSSGFQDTSLSELLEAAKNKRRNGSRGRNRPSSSSVNSAPAITASYLRQHHNLGSRYSTRTYHSSKDRLNITGDGSTSVSDIIESLEATKRGNKVYSHRSVGETGAVATARAAKERLREKRRRERESQGLHVSRSAEVSDSDESGHEASESWLFDEVTGALGPRGIAADLESLSGRSNRSKNSHGNKSHKSSRRKSSRNRRHRSDRSVDSHGSRTSRNSRYSHRSTKSFLSQMSEQSRSVANDLLRLEMQLAMVGSQDKRDDSAGVRPGSSSVSLGGASRGTSRSTRRSLNASTASSSRGIHQSSSSAQISSVVVRRSKITVVAPPGKLGIILANKADSKGTVVSGVRTSSVLVDRISPGDRIVAIDGEDVSRMTVSEITTIMSRKAEYERRLTVLTIPKPGISGNTGGSPPDASSMRTPTNQGTASNEFETGFASVGYRR